MAIGKVKFIAASGGALNPPMYGYKPILDIRNLPKELQNHPNLDGCVQVLVNHLGAKVWINEKRSDILLDNPKMTGGL